MWEQNKCKSYKSRVKELDNSEITVIPEDKSSKSRRIIRGLSQAKTLLVSLWGFSLMPHVQKKNGKTKTKEKSATIIVILPLDVPQWKQKME